MLRLPKQKKKHCRKTQQHILMMYFLKLPAMVGRHNPGGGV